jgi:hypothetical protein
VLKEAVVIELKDGKVADFLTEEAQAKWANPTQEAIEIVVECKHNDESYKDAKIFPYRVDTNGVTVYTPKSNLGKYAKYYKKLPEVGDQVQMKTNADGYFKLVIE